MSVLGELKRRKMFQVIAVYAVVAWLVVQVITSIEQPLNLPDWTDTLVIVLLALGFPVLLVVSWAFNVTPEGMVRDQGDDEAGKSPGRTIEFVLIGLVGIAVAWLIYRTEFDAPTATDPVVTEEAAADVRPNSIAVLPFANLSPDPDNAFFASGIHDSILNELAKINDMHVISRTTMMRYADTGENDAGDRRRTASGNCHGRQRPVRKRSRAGHGTAHRSTVGFASLVRKLRSRLRGHFCHTGGYRHAHCPGDAGRAVTGGPAKPRRPNDRFARGLCLLHASDGTCFLGLESGR